jgi:hypothetical protein
MHHGLGKLQNTAIVMKFFARVTGVEDSSAIVSKVNVTLIQPYLLLPNPKHSLGLANPCPCQSFPSMSPCEVGDFLCNAMVVSLSCKNVSNGALADFGFCSVCNLGEGFPLLGE